MSRHLKLFTALMTWVVLTAGAVVTFPDTASASSETAERQRVDLGALLTTAALNSSPNLGGLPPLGTFVGASAVDDEAIEAGEGVEGYHEELGEDAWRPAPRISPPVGAQQIVGLYTWLAIDPDAWQDVQIDGRENKAGYVYTASPIRTIWTFSDRVVTCDGPGDLYAEGAEGPPDCGRTWTHTSEVAPMTMEVAIEYEVTWEEYEEECTDIDESESCGSEKIDGVGGTYVQKGDPLDTYDLRIGEIQSIGTAEDHESLPSGTDFRSEQDSIESELGYNQCGELQVFCDFAEEVREEIVGQLTNIAGFVIRTLMQGISWLRSILPDELKVVLDFVEGCVDQFDDILEGMLSSVDEILAGPIAYFSNLFEDIILLIQAISTDPVKFATEFLREELELDEAEENLVSWAGGWACEFALDAVTGGSQRLDDLGGWLDGVSDTFDDRPEAPRTAPERDRDSGDSDSDSDRDDGNNNGQDDDLTDSCDANSFPTGTLVLMADRSRQPIDQIEPGDLVLAADESTGIWSPRTVVDQWHHLDDGVMATVTLSDGSQVTATDHHQFWVQSDGAWTELDQVQPGDFLLTPDGVTEVAAVELTDPQRTLVWELDVAVDDTFAVFTGSEDVLVHNAGCSIEGDFGEKVPGTSLEIGEGPKILLISTELSGRKRAHIRDKHGNMVKTNEPRANMHSTVVNPDGSTTYQHNDLSIPPITYKDGFPIFDDHAAVDLYFETNYYNNNPFGQTTRATDFRQANIQTQQAFISDPTLFSGLPQWQQNFLENFYDSNNNMSSSSPSPHFTWHHHEDVGRMQLVLSSVHGAYPHHGGEAIWGGL